MECNQNGNVNINIYIWYYKCISIIDSLAIYISHEDNKQIKQINLYKSIFCCERKIEGFESTLMLLERFGSCGITKLPILHYNYCNFDVLHYLNQSV